MERGRLIEIVRATGAGVETGGGIFLGDPAWSEAQRAQVRAVQARPDQRPDGETGGWLGVPTGGTQGGVRFARHDEHTFGAAVAGFCGHFGVDRCHALDVLPPYHVSGLLARARVAATGGEHRAWSWRQLEAGQRPALAAHADGWMISLVPTQLQRLLAAPAMVAWLREFRLILLGGGPVWGQLADAAAEASLPVVLSYGMTETAAMVAAQRPGEFRRGERGVGRALPHAGIEITVDGVVRVASAAVYRGYWPEWREAREFLTEDLGRLDAAGRLEILGRRDAVIITGGKKVQPMEVEEALRASGEFSDVVVLGLPDPEWGEVVVACFPREVTRTPDLGRAVAGLAAAQRPKHFVPIAGWSRTAQGKVNRAELRAAAGAWLGSAERVRR